MANSKSNFGIRVVPESRRNITAGYKSGRITVIGDPFYVKLKRSPAAAVVCECDCGTVFVVRCLSVLNGVTQSCGCLHRDRVVASIGKHFGTYTRLYNIWCKMIARCHTKSDHAWRWYGARGIAVCGEWRSSFEIFREWAGQNGYTDELTIERIDNDFGYCPSNCKWIPMSEQAKNRRANKKIVAFGETKSIAEWSRDERCRVAIGALGFRLRSGWEPERALSTPKISKRERLIVPCACGCGRTLENRDSKGRIRRFICGHRKFLEVWE